MRPGVPDWDARNARIASSSRVVAQVDSTTHADCPISRWRGERRTAVMRLSAADAVAKVGDATLTFKNSDSL